jgi:hypothetical protein
VVNVDRYLEVRQNPAFWGWDHVSTLLYAYARWIDHSGRINHDQMRKTSSDCPTRLAGDELLEGHDDYDCLLDLQAQGLIRAYVGSVSRRLVFTPRGQLVVAVIHQARADCERMKDAQIDALHEAMAVVTEQLVGLLETRRYLQ